MNNEELNKIVNSYLQEHNHDVLLSPYNGLMEFGKLVCQWQREQMMKEAVEGKIIFLFNGDVAINIGDTDKYKLGDNVRIVIVKED